MPTTTAPAVAQVSPSPRQAELRRFLRGCHVEPFRDDQAHEVGALLARAGTADVVDGHVVITAVATSAAIWTSDPDGLGRLNDQLPEPLKIRRL